jgi:tRNA-Thr(GGU) m(6)t(6)A37 methyltransferase TsaA
MSCELTPIGTVKNGIHKRPEKWADILSEIHIKKEFQEALNGLSDFSHIMVIFYLHLSGGSVLKVHPRGRGDLPEVGVFSTRAPVRPNPLGVSIVELVKIEENILTVKGLDTFDQTPILDIKPHLPTVSPKRMPEWVRR